MSDSPKKNPLVPPFQFNDWSTPQTTSVRMPPFAADSVQATTGHMRKIIDDLTAERDAALIESSALKAEVERLSKDAARLDFIERRQYELTIWPNDDNQACEWFCDDPVMLSPVIVAHPTVRAAIDAAIKESQP